MVNLEKLIEFASGYYMHKDPMHGFEHVKRLSQNANELGTGKEYDRQVVCAAAYLHGIIDEQEKQIIEFLCMQGCAPDFQKTLLRTARESLVNSSPESLEGILLHDAHLIEGGKVYLVTKSLLTGSERGQSLKETAAYMKQFILGKRQCILPEAQCILPEAQCIYEEMESFAWSFLQDLETGLKFETNN